MIFVLADTMHRSGYQSHFNPVHPQGRPIMNSPTLVRSFPVPLPAAVSAVREHVRELRSAGMSDRQLTVLAQVNVETIAVLMSGQADRPAAFSGPVLQAAAARLLAVPMPDAPWATAPAEQLVDATGTLRRLQALVADGRSPSALATEIGLRAGDVTALLTGLVVRVPAGMTRTVAEAFERLQLHPGTDEAARQRGRFAGWLLPLEWDEDRIDEPTFTPERSRRPKLTQRDETAERRRIVAQWLDDPSHSTTEELARRLGTSERTIERDKAFIRQQRQAPTSPAVLQQRAS